MSDRDRLEDRLIDFALRVIKVAEALPRTAAGRHVASQILRSGTSPAPNYGEARGAESRADFQHKLKVVLKELKETMIWLKIILRAGMIASAKLTPLIDENEQLCRIVGASVKTSRSRQGTASDN